MWPVVILSALIAMHWWKMLYAVISTNEKIEFITGHVILNGAYNEIFQLKTTKHELGADHPKLTMFINMKIKIVIFLQKWFDPIV